MMILKQTFVIQLLSQTQTASIFLNTKGGKIFCFELHVHKKKIKNEHFEERAYLGYGLNKWLFQRLKGCVYIGRGGSLEK